MMQLLTTEQEKEQAREKKLASCHDAIEKHDLESRFGIERSKAQKLIQKTMERHA
jgi:hypothetical protein